MNEDFSKGERGAVVKPDPNKVRITIRLDADVIEHFKNLVHEAGGGNYQTLINQALREHIQAQDKSLEDTLRRVIREEVKKAGSSDIDAGVARARFGDPLQEYPKGTRDLQVINADINNPPVGAPAFGAIDGDWLDGLKTHRGRCGRSCIIHFNRV